MDTLSNLVENYPNLWEEIAKAFSVSPKDAKALAESGQIILVNQDEMILSLARSVPSLHAFAGSAWENAQVTLNGDRHPA